MQLVDFKPQHFFHTCKLLGNNKSRQIKEVDIPVMLLIICRYSLKAGVSGNDQRAPAAVYGDSKINTIKISKCGFLWNT